MANISMSSKSVCCVRVQFLKHTAFGDDNSLQMIFCSNYS